MWESFTVKGVGYVCEGISITVSDEGDELLSCLSTKETRPGEKEGGKKQTMASATRFRLMSPPPTLLADFLAGMWI